MGMTAVACFILATAIPFATMRVDLQADKLGCKLGVALGASLIPAILDRDGAALDPAEFTHSLHKSSRPWAPQRRVCPQEPDGRQLARLLSMCRERPCSRAADERDDLAPPHKISPQDEDDTLAHRWARAVLCIAEKWPAD
jgi:hypothetical protein